MTTLTSMDSRIREDVEAELAFDPRFEPSEVGVRVMGGVVTLFGQVESYTKRLAAEKCAHAVRGVIAVVNDLEVQIPSTEIRTDEAIAGAAANALAWNSNVPHKHIDITVTEGRVILRGEVDWDYQREAAERAVHELSGVASVGNYLTVRKRPTPSNVKHQIVAALERAAMTDAKQIGVDVRDGTVTLHGRVRSFAEREDARRAAWNVPGVIAVENNLLIEP